MNIHFETSRFIVRDIEQIDIKDMFEMDSDPEVHQYLGKNPVKSMQESEAIIRYIKAQYKQYGMGRWAVIDKKSNEFLGWIGLKYETKVRKSFNYYDLGYRFKKKYWGQGIATETAEASLKYGFYTLGLNKICAAAEVNHVASNTILKKIGFKCVEVFDFENVLHNWYEISK